MSYLVLARKWRPQNFEQLIGQQHVTTTLRNAIRSKRIAHAYLFSGESGIGKRLTAFALAAALNCEAPGAGGGCGACSACRRVAGGIHPDVRIVMPRYGNIDGAKYGLRAITAPFAAA